MSLPLILALNAGIATLLTLTVALVMAGPGRLRPHHHASAVLVGHRNLAPDN